MKKLTASDASGAGIFGSGGGTFGIWGLDIRGDLIVVGADQHGAAYVFERNEGGSNNWGEVKKLTASDSAVDDHFGTGIAIGNDTIFVGAYNTKTVYIFERNLGGTDNWGEKTTLTASDDTADRYFGHAIAIHDDTLVIAAPHAKIGDNFGQGAAYVFERDSGTNTWNEVKQLIASDGAASDSFSSKIAIHGDTIVVGTYLDNQDNNADQGKVYVFERDEGGSDAWGEVEILTASDGTLNDVFGAAVVLNSDTLIIGADKADVDGTADQGAAYIFSRADDATPTMTATDETATTTPEETTTATTTPDETVTTDPDETVTTDPDETTTVTTTPEPTATANPDATPTVTTTPDETVTPDSQETPTLEPHATPTLTITITCSNQVKPGNEVVCTITYENNSSTSASNVQLIITLPDGTLFNAELSTPGWQPATTLRSNTEQYAFSLGTLEAGVQGTVQASITVDRKVPAGNTIDIGLDIMSDSTDSSSEQSSNRATIVVNPYAIYMPMIGNPTSRS